MPIWAELLGFMVPVIVACLGWAGSRSAQKIAAKSAEQTALKTAELEREKVDQAAYDRARVIYVAAIERLEKQAEQDRVAMEKLQKKLNEANETIERQRALLEKYEIQQRRTDAELSELRKRLAEVEARAESAKEMGKNDDAD